MAKLFLSYSRKDEAKARRFTQWLEREGHDVWRDEEDIGGGASFSSEIEKALKESDAVLVLWSVDSVQSAWVRDEAGFGRDAGKLIPLSLDGTEPPLGFRQFQSINLSRWKGHREPPDAGRVRNAIARVSDLPQIGGGSQPAERSGWRETLFGERLLVGGLFAVALAAALALFLWRPWSSNEQIAIAVVPSSGSPDPKMAADYANLAAADLAASLPRRFDRVTVIAPADANGRNAAYTMKISTDPHGAGANATLTLSDEDGGATLWSRNWSVENATAADLKAAVSASASKAAFCLTSARGGRPRLTQPALGLFLSGCAELGETNESNRDFEAAFERVTKLAPEFGPAWGYLALSRSWIAEGLPDSSPARAAAVQSARDAIRIARKLNPNSAMTYDAEYHLTNGDTFRALQVLEQGAKIDPDDGRVQMHLSEEYRFVGRMSDSVQAAERGIELEPGSTYSRSQYILALIYSGKFSKAQADVAEARRKWPNDQNIDFADFSFQFRYGDAREALGLLPRITDASDAEMAPTRKVIAARLDPTAAKIDDAIAALESQSSNNQDARNRVLLALATFGRTAQVYQLLENPQFQPAIAKDELFRPEFAPVRADPRFMQVAASLGLVRYWRQTGYWPDFCTSERLRYDCRAEGAKYRN